MSTDMNAALSAFRQIIKLADDPRKLTEIKQVAHQILVDAGHAESKTFDPVPADLMLFKGKQLLIVRVPLEIVFSEEPVELDDRTDEPKATDKQISKYIDSGAIVCDFNTEDHSQLTGAAIQSMGLKLRQMQIIRP